MRTQLDVDFFTPEMVIDPYPTYDQIREVGPVVWNGTMGGWNVVGYDACLNVLGDQGTQHAIRFGEAPWFVDKNMMIVDGATHKRLRGAISPYLTRSAVARWEHRVREVCEALMAPLATGSGRYDLIEDFTKIPTVIMAEMLGVPPERYDDFQRWSQTVTSNITLIHHDDEARAILDKAASEVNDYILEEIERHRREKPDDLMTAMLDAPDESRMSDSEIQSTCVLLVLGGYDTTAKTLSNTLIALERHPDQRRELAADPSLLPGAIEEALRFAGPSTYIVPRVAQSPCELGGEEIAAGDMLFVFVAAGNRDPSRWEDPNRFDIHREPKSHLGFGFGPHMCIGAPLARLEIKVALEVLLTIAPEYRLEDIDLGSNFFLRGPRAGTIAR